MQYAAVFVSTYYKKRRENWQPFMAERANGFSAKLFKDSSDNVRSLYAGGANARVSSGAALAFALQIETLLAIKRTP